MPINFPYGFTVTSTESIDQRLLMTVAQMKTAGVRMPDHYITICADGEDAGKIFLFDKENEVDETYGKFRRLAYDDLDKLPFIPSALADMSSDSEHNTVTLSQIAAWNAKIGGIKVNGVDQEPDENTVVDLHVPVDVSELNNDAGYITIDVNDLINYYTKVEIDAKLDEQMRIVAVASLDDVHDPDTHTIYLVPSTVATLRNARDEYIWTGANWELIGSTTMKLNIVQSANGITINGDVLQNASVVQDGLMPKESFIKLEGIENGAEVNVLEGVIIDGSTQQIDANKNAVLNLSAYAKKSDVASALRYKGSVERYVDLPATPSVGDVWNIAQADPSHSVKEGDNVAWTGTEWDVLAGTTDLSDYITTVEAERKIAVVQADVDAHEARTDNPHQVTKAQVGLGDVENHAMDIAPTSGSSNYVSSGGVYTVASELSTSISDLAATVDTEVSALHTELDTHKSDTENPHQVTKAQVGLGDVENHPMDATPTQDSANYVSSGGVFDAVEGVQTELNTHKSDTDNPHQVTKVQVGLGSVENHPMDATPTQDSANYVSSGGTYSAIQAVQEDIGSHAGRKDNPHEVTKAQVGLSLVENQPMDNAPIESSSHYVKSGGVYSSIKSVRDDVDAHVADKANPHEVTKAQVGLSDVENHGMDVNPTEDSENYVSSGGVYSAVKTVQDDVDAHEARVDNPHSVTKAQVGLGDVENHGMDVTPTEDSTNYVSSGGTYEAIETVQTTVDTHIADTNNPHGVTKAQVGLSDVENHPMDENPIESSNNYVKSGGVYTAVKTVQGNLNAHEARKDNPHQVTKAQIGLGDVENHPLDAVPTQNSDNYVKSGGVYDANVALQSQITANTRDIATNAENIATNAENIATNAEDIADLQATKVDKVEGSSLIPINKIEKLDGIEAGAEVNAIETISIEGIPQTIDTHRNVELDLSTYAKKADIASALKYKGSVNTYADLPENPSIGDVWNVVEADPTHGVKEGDNVAWNGTAWDVLGGTTDLSAYITTEDAMAAIGVVQDHVDDVQGDLEALTTEHNTLQTQVDTHEARVDNPHSVTKAQVGLGSVENHPMDAVPTEDSANYVSSGGAYSAISTVQADLDTFKARTDNPHQVTKAQVGLSSVENRPMDAIPAASSVNYISSGGVHSAISTVQTALGTHVARTDNPHQVTKAQVGLSDVVNKPTDIRPVESSTNYVSSGGMYEAMDELQTEVDTHEARADNPHNVTKGQVGLGSVENRPMDSAPTVNSANYVTSGGAYSAINTVQTALNTHAGRTDNPHSVTKAQVGLSLVENHSMDVDPTEDSVNYVTSGGVYSAISATQNDLNTFKARTDNPHSVTKAQVGLGNVDNTSDVNKPVSTAQRVALDLKLDDEQLVNSWSSPVSDTNIPSEKLVKDNLDMKVDKLNSSSKVYVTDATGADAAIEYGTGNVGNNIVQRQSNSEITVPATPQATTDATSKSYVDTQVNTRVPANASVVAGTHTKITYDEKGLVTDGTELIAADIPQLDASKIVTGIFPAERLPDLAQSKIIGLTTRLDTDESNIQSIQSKIPSQATATNQLADKEYVNSAITTNSADFLGTFNLEDLELDYPSTDEQIIAKLEERTWESEPTNNDYVLVAIVDPVTEAVEEYRRFKYYERTWVFEYALNNSSFSTSQWAAINSDLTHDDRVKLDTIATGAQVNVQANWDQTDPTQDEYIKNKPAIPVVNDGIITLQRNGTSVGQFSVNQSTPSTFNIIVPTVASDVHALPDDTVYVETVNGQSGALTGLVDTAGTGLSKSGTTLNHSATILPDSTSTGSATHGGNITYVDSITRDATGHVTKINTRTTTLPPETVTSVNSYTGDVELTYSDVNALPDTTVFVSSVNGASGAVTVQPTLVSGTNIKTINSTSILGGGNVEVASTDLTNVNVGSAYATKYVKVDSDGSMTYDDPTIDIDPALSTTSTNPVENRVVKAALDTKTDITMAIGEWSSSRTYSTGSTVVVDGYIYTSLVDDNTSSVSDTTKWRKLGERGPQGIQGPQGYSVQASISEGILTVTNYNSSMQPISTTSENVIGPQGIQGARGYSVQGNLTQDGTLTITNYNSDMEVISELVENVTGPMGPGLPVGGTPGEVLVKRSNENYDYDWESMGSVAVTSVNNRRGDVTLTYTDVNALPNDTIFVSTIDGRDGAVTTKTINNNEILGSGNISVQEVLVGSGAGQNIKTINSESLLGSGNISIPIITIDDELDDLSTNPVQNAVISALIPNAASSSNQLADKAFVNSSISTSTADFLGTYNIVDDLGLREEDKDDHVLVAGAIATVVSSPTLNDYVFVEINSASGARQYDRYKFSSDSWAYEYTLNNSAFTASQWDAINSGVSANHYVTSVNGAVGAVTVQPTLVSGTNIKTVNSNSLLGSGNIAITPASIGALPDTTVYVSTVNGNGGAISLKTIEGNSLIGTGNIDLPDYEGWEFDSRISRTITVTQDPTEVAIGNLTFEAGVRYMLITSTAYNQGDVKYITLMNTETIRTAADASITVYGKSLKGSSITQVMYFDIWKQIDESVLSDSIPVTFIGTSSINVQPTLVSGTNIKTINGTSILGSGNFDLPKVVVDSALDAVSTNPVENKAVYAALQLKQNVLTPGVDYVVPASLSNGDVTKIGTANVGTNTKPIKIVGGVPTAVANDFVDVATTQTIRGAKTFENTSTSESNVTLTLKSANQDVEGTPDDNSFNSVNFTDANDVLVAKASSIQTNTGETGFVIGVGSDPTNIQNNVTLVTDGDGKALYIPPTSSDAKSAVRKDHYDTNTVTDVSYNSSNKTLSRSKNGASATVVTFGANAFTDTVIPTVYNPTVKIQKNGTDLGSFTLNQSTGATINIPVPVTAEDVNALPNTTVYVSKVNGESGEVSVQPTLVGSGTGQNIKTINSTNILGSGNIALQTPLTPGTDYVGHVASASVLYGTNASKVDTSYNLVSAWQATPSDTSVPTEKLVKSGLDTKQATLIGTNGATGQNIKAINGTSILGSGSISLQTPLTPGTHYVAHNGTASILYGTDSSKSDKVYNITSQGSSTESQFTPSSTDSQVPTSKAVYTALASIQDTLVFDSALDLTSENPVQNKVISSKMYTTTGSLGSGISTTNPLALKDYVDNAISTSAATYISDDGNPFTSVDDLPTTGVNINDYAFVTGVDSSGNTYYDRYKYDGSSWAKEYRLNNSSFTTTQWAAINSGVSSGNYVTTVNGSSGAVTVQPTLVGSGTGQNIKTINSTNLLGSGNIAVQTPLTAGTDYVAHSATASILYGTNSSKADTTYKLVTAWQTTTADTNVPSEKLVKAAIDTKQATLVSGTNIKTINGGSILGSGNVALQTPLTAGTDYVAHNGTASVLYGTNASKADTAYSVTLQGSATTSQFSSTSTDAQVPTSKAVYTALTTKQDTVTAGTALKFSGSTLNHNVTVATDTTSTASPGYGGTFTVIDSVTRDSVGHVTKVNTKTVTIPASDNVDTKVQQTADAATTTAIPILLKTVQTSGTAGPSVYCSNVTITPSSGTLTATKFSGPLAGNVTGNVTGNCSGSSGSCTGNSATATTLATTATTTIATTAGVQFYTGTILSQEGSWCIETYKSGTLIMQRATSLADPCHVAVRTSTDSGTTWAGWTYSYAVWKA